jgi:hypothetical protein
MLTMQMADGVWQEVWCSVSPATLGLATIHEISCRVQRLTFGKTRVCILVARCSYGCAYAA